MKILIFGTGKIYQKNKESIKKTVEVVAFLDNNINKWGTILDGKKIYSPQEIPALDYDYIALFSRSDGDMKEQLITLGVRNENILQYDKLYKVLECAPARMEGELQENSRKKILIFSHAFTFSGAQNVLFHSIEIFLEHGYGIVCVSNKDGQLRQKLREKGVVVILCQDFTDPVVRQAIDWADMLMINTLWLQYLVEEYANCGKRIIWWLHESGSLQRYHPFGLNDLLEKDNIEIYAVSQTVIDYLEQMYEVKDKIRILVFGLQEYITEREKNEKTTFLQIGPFCELKGQDILINAINSLPQDIKIHARFILIGGGEVTEELQALIKQNPCVELVGQVDNEQVPAYYALSDVVICCSREESMSVVVMEGFMNGIPAIVSDVTGITEYMEAGREGLIYQSENVSELQQKIIYMIENQDQVEEMGKRARENYTKNFSMGQFQKNLLRVVEV